MDGLSLAASVIAVIQLARSCLKLSKKWIGPSEFGSSDLATMTTALYEFNGAMKTFQTHLEIHEDDEARLSSLEYLNPALGRCEEALNIIKDFMEGSSFIRKHLIGPKFDRNLKTSLKALNGAKELFMLALQADQQAILLGVERYVRNVAEDLRDIHDVVKDNKRKLDELNEDQKARAHWDERQAVLDWLTLIDYAPQQSDFINQRQTGTGQWLLDSQEFKTWVETDKQTLFCLGIPGAGKTIITSIVVEDLHTRFQNEANIGIAYLYCNFRRQQEQNPEDLLASLLKQLIQEEPPMPKSIKSLYERHRDKRTRPSFDEISKALLSVVTDYSKAFIIIDALDEHQVSDRGRRKFLLEVFNLQAKTGANLFATSRFIPEIEKQFQGCLYLEIRAIDEDVQKYLDGHMSRLPSFVIRSPHLQKEIKTEIIKAVDGMFLLAKLHLDSLTGKKSPKAIRTKLKKLPTGSGAYDHAYNDAMERIDCQITDSQELAKQVLAWITCAKRPLTTTELQHALAVEIGESALDEDNLPQIEDMVSVCAGLVTVDDESHIIRLVHYTTQEYFERTKGKWFPSAETDITTICVTYLSFHVFETGFCPTDEEFEVRLQLNALYNYAARNWGHHARTASAEAGQLILDLLESEAKVSGCSQAMMASGNYYGYSQMVPKQVTRVHLTAYFGLGEVMEVLLKGRFDLDCKDSKGQTPLLYAAEYGREVAVKLLLEKGAELETKDYNGQTPLSRADPAFVNRKGLTLAHLYANCIRMKVSTLKILMELGVDMSATDLEGRTLLHHIALNGSLTEDVLMYLLDETTLRTDIRDSAGKTPVQCAFKQAEDTRSTRVIDSERWARTLEIFLKYKSRIRAASGLNTVEIMGM